MQKVYVTDMKLREALSKSSKYLNIMVLSDADYNNCLDKDTVVKVTSKLKERTSNNPLTIGADTDKPWLDMIYYRYDTKLIIPNHHLFDVIGQHFGMVAAKMLLNWVMIKGPIINNHKYIIQTVNLADGDVPTFDEWKKTNEHI